MKIAIIWQRFLPYHIARLKRLHDICNAAGHTIIAIEIAANDESYKDITAPAKTDFEYICCFPETIYHNLNLKDIRAKVTEVLTSIDPNVIFAPATPFPEGMAAILYRTNYNKKVIVMDDAWQHTDRKGFLSRLIKKTIHSNVDGAFIPADSHRPYYRSLGFLDSRLVIGVDVVDNKYFAENADIARQSALDLHASLKLPVKYFLFVGRLLPCKGLETLLKAYALYTKTRKKDGDWELIIVGNGSYMGEMQRFASGFSTVHFVGRQCGVDLCRYYGLAEVLIVPSDMDTWGLVINEGMACGLPIIASRACGATATLVNEEGNGWTFNAGDFNGLAELMLKAVGKEPEVLKMMGQKSLDIIRDWDLDLFADGVLKALNIPRRKPAGLISEVLTRIWKGRVRIR